MLKYSWLLIFVFVACGEDEAPSRPPPAPGAPSAATKRAAAAKKGKPGKLLVSRVKAEDRVDCPLPGAIAKGTKTCDAQALLCEPVAVGEPKDYCLPYIDGKHYCLPCAERDSIRHAFNDRDFAPEQSNRDPFQSYVLAQKGLDPSGDGIALPREITKDCTEKNWIARNYSYTDLRLVGIVAERAQRRVLMMDKANLGHLLRKNDCVGREKAIVKDVGAGYITFQVKPDETLTGQPRAVEEHSVQLYPNQMPVTSQPRLDEPARDPAPVVAPPTGMPSADVVEESN